MRGAASFIIMFGIAACSPPAEQTDGPDAGTDESPLTSTLRITHWNIQVNGEGTDTITDIDRTYQTLRAKAADADIITCNECYASTTNSFATRLTQDTGKTWYAVPQFDLGSHNHSGILSRYPLASAPTPFYYSQPASMSDGPKSAGEIDINVNGTIIHLIVTRLCSPCGGSVRAVQAQELVAWAAQKWPEPRIITGDFNDGLTASSVTTMKATYVDVYRQAASIGTATAYTDNPSGYTHGCGIIDYLWVGKGASQISVVDSKVPDLRATPLANPNAAVKEKVGCSDDWGVRPSDHNMVRGTFTITTSTTTSTSMPPGWVAADVGAVGQTGATAYSGGTFTIDAGGTSIYSTADAFRYVYQPWVGDGVIVARVASIAANGGTDAGAGVMFRQSATSAGSPLASMLVFASGKAKFRYRATQGADINGTCCSTGPASSAGPPRWVKLTRSGNHFEGFLSSDGASWGSPVATADVAMPTTISVGIAAWREGNFSGPTSEALVSNVSLSSPGLPSPWRVADVGAIDVAGTTTYASGSYSIDAGGTWIWSTSDAFHFVHEPWRGDGTVVAHVDSLTLGGGTDSAVGVTFRSDLSAASPVASMLVFYSGKAKFRFRATAGADINSTCCSSGPTTGGAPPRWIKITRVGNHFEGFVSSDGSSWGTAIGSADIALPQNLYVGVAAVREGSGGTARAHAVVSSMSVQ